MFSGNEIDPPDVGRSRRYYGNGSLIGRKHLPGRDANARRQTAVHRHPVRRAIFVAMIVPKQYSVFTPGQHPSPRAVFANNERNADTTLFTRTKVHRESLIFKRRVIGRSRGHHPHKGLSAELLELVPKDDVGGPGLRPDSYR